MIKHRNDATSDTICIKIVTACFGVGIVKKAFPTQSYTIYVMVFAIWYHLCNLKSVKNTNGGVLPLVTLQAECYVIKDTDWIQHYYLKQYSSKI